MEVEMTASLLLSIGGVIVSVASAFTVVKVKVAQLEQEVEEYKHIIDTLKEEQARYREDEKVRIALLEQNQEAHARELAELKSDIKTIMGNVQEIKEAVLTAKKGTA